MRTRELGDWDTKNDTWPKDCSFDIWKKIVLWCYDACLFCIKSSLRFLLWGMKLWPPDAETAAEEIEREMRKCHAPDGEESVSSMRWRVQRSRQPMDLDLTPTLLHSDGTEHIVATCPGWSSLVQGAKGCAPGSQSQCFRGLKNRCLDRLKQYWKICSINIQQSYNQWIGFRENLQETMFFF